MGPVEQDHVGTLPRADMQGLGAAARSTHLEILGRQPRFEKLHIGVDVVDDKDVTGLKVTSSAIRVTGQVEVEEQGPLVSFELSLSGTISQDVRIQPEADGPFETILPEGEYRVTEQSINPDAYPFTSFTSGSIDLLKEPLKVSKIAPPQLALKLAAIQPPLWVKLAGKTTGLEYLPSDSRPRVVLTGGIVRSTIEAPIAADGSF